jgi:hypothetical protein
MFYRKPSQRTDLVVAEATPDCRNQLIVDEACHREGGLLGVAATESKTNILQRKPDADAYAL